MLVPFTPAFVLLAIALLFAQAADWSDEIDKLLAKGCSSSQTSCYNKYKLTSCGAQDYECMCHNLKKSASCLDDCNDGANKYLAEQQAIVECQAAAFYATATGELSSDTADNPTATSEETVDLGSMPTTTNGGNVDGPVTITRTESSKPSKTSKSESSFAEKAGLHGLVPGLAVLVLVFLPSLTA